MGDYDNYEAPANNRSRSPSPQRQQERPKVSFEGLAGPQQFSGAALIALLFVITYLCCVVLVWCVNMVKEHKLYIGNRKSSKLVSSATATTITSKIVMNRILHVMPI